jgi:excisionase family DNA binding protein
MSKSTNCRESGKDVLRVFAEALIPYVLDRLQISDSQSDPAFYSQANSPLGRRRHLELARRGTLQGRKVGRLVLVPREEVHAFIELHPARPSSSQIPDSPLADWGLVSRRRR